MKIRDARQTRPTEWCSSQGGWKGTETMKRFSNLAGIRLLQTTRFRQTVVSLCFVALCFLVAAAVELAADEDPPQKNTEVPAAFQKITKQAVPLNRQKTLFLDRKEKCLYLQGTVVLDAGLLEMLCCREQTKEHESIIAVNCKAFPIHTGLLALKAKPGKPVSFNPKYQPPTGEKIAIFVIYVNQEGKLIQQDAHQWVRSVTRRYFFTPLARQPVDLTIPEKCNMKYDRRRRELLYYGTMSPDELKRLQQLSEDKKYRDALQKIYQLSQPHLLQADWVFAGSLFQKDPQTGEQRYLAEGGDYICVANFASAMIDVAIPSSASDANRGFEANSDLIPPPGTPVLLKLQRAVDSKQGK